MVGDTLIEDLFAGRWRDPDSGETPRLPIAAIVVERTLDGREAQLIAPLGLGARLAVVSDPRTHEALGRRVGRALERIATIDQVVLAAPHADLELAEQLIERSRAAEALIAVGSGTINDLCKYAAHATGRPYAVFATAPSMNGYLTATASLAGGGVKASQPARPPRAALFDLEVLARAPVRLLRAGLGDVICRTTAQTDWLLGHLLIDTAYREAPFALQAADEPPLLDRAGGLAAGDLGAVAQLTRMLVLSGLGMVLVGSSHPGSMAEHLISHYLDTMAGAAHPGSLHGEQVGVATLTVSRLQHALLDLDEPPTLGPTPIDERALFARYGAGIAPHCLAELGAKALDRPAAARLNARLAERWGEITRRLGAVMLPTGRLAQALRAAGAPTTAAELGLDPAFYREAVLCARELRNRLTILDLAADAGVLGDVAALET